jgi:predicted molibdopterin-dependent oxidoreductase YjgC
MFEPIGSVGDERIEFTFEGRTVTAPKTASVASALLAAGETAFRISPVTGLPRGPFCMMGVCFDCLVEIDDAPNRQACMTGVVEGMVVRRQRVASAAEPS